MIRVIAGKNAAEAQFRATASNLRERGAITLEGNATSPHHLLSEAFNAVVGRWRDLCIQLMRTTLVSHGNIMAAPVIAWVLCAPKYLVGIMSLGEVAQVVAAFVIVQTSLNWLVDNYPGLADCLSSGNRVAALLLALDEFDRDSEHQYAERSEVSVLGGQRGERTRNASPWGDSRHLGGSSAGPANQQQEAWDERVRE